MRVNGDYVLQGRCISLSYLPKISLSLITTIASGTFEAHENLHRVYQFVREALVDSQASFQLQTQHDRAKLEDSEAITLKKAGVVPSATLVTLGEKLSLKPALVTTAEQLV